MINTEIKDKKMMKMISLEDISVIYKTNDESFELKLVQNKFYGNYMGYKCNCGKKRI